MKKISVLGAGMVGSAIARDLKTRFDVTSYDAYEHNFSLLHGGGIKTSLSDLRNSENIRDAIKDADIVVNALPGFMGFETLKTIIQSKKDVIDISFFPEDALQLDNLAKENHATAIVDFGVAPGISNFILGHHYNSMQIDDFVCYVGGLPKERIMPFQYKAPFSPIDVIEEYTREARFVQDGKIVAKPAMTDREFLHFDEIGTLEAFNSDGLRSLLTTVKIPNMIEKTLRYPGHIENIVMLRDMGFFSHDKININGSNVQIIEFASKVLINQWKLHENDEEFTIMKIGISGKENDKKITYVYNLLDRTDTANKISSMARTTGYAATAAVNLFADNLFNKKGVFPPENIPVNNNIFDYVFNYMNERNIVYRVDAIFENN